MKRKSVLIGAAVAVAVVTVGTIGATTLLRDSASAREVAEMRTGKPLPLVTGDALPRTNGELAQQISSLQAQIAHAPNDAPKWKQLGLTQMQAARHDAAIDAYKRAVALTPQDAAAWSALGEAYSHAVTSSTSKMPAEARAAFDKALSLDATNVRARFYIALEKDYSGQHDAAINDWLTLLREVPSESGPDVAIRAAILDSLNRNIRLVSQAVEDTRQVQPRADVKS